METNNGNPCDYLFDCLVGEATPAMRKAFESHLADCPSCKKEWDELSEVWSTLPDLTDAIEPPAELKAEVMRHIFGEKRSELPMPAAEAANIQVERTVVQEQPTTVKSYRTIVSRWRIAFGVAVAALLLVAAVSIYNIQFKNTMTVNAVEGPLYVEQTYVLNADDQSAKARGTGYIVCQGNNKRLVLNTIGLETTTNDEAYQVWLIHEGKRQNAGTFWVDGQGNGVLVYDITGNNSPFEKIGITLEPDSHGSQPRGKKVLGN
ncbi:MAG: hypothetical protein K0Q73_6702 [Paenibacillus sp.]|jgi:hypothetical protein|nr:hypothetical protein [Paenibacillus sp.]